MINFNCSSCGKRLTISDEYAGRNATCPQCRQIITIPVQSTGQDMSGVQASQPSATSPGLQASPPQPPPQTAYQQPAYQTSPQYGSAQAQQWHQQAPYYPGVVPYGHSLSKFPTGVVILLHFLTLGIFTTIWLNLMHGKMSKVRPNDPSAGKAIGFLFIPFFNFYWVFFTYHRLCVRLNEQRRAFGLPESVPKGLAIATCVLLFVPYIGGYISFLILMPIFAGIVQSNVNELTRVTQHYYSGYGQQQSTTMYR